MSKLHSSTFTSQALKGIFFKPKMSEKVKKKKPNREKHGEEVSLVADLKTALSSCSPYACKEAHGCCQKLTTQRPHKWCEHLPSTAPQTSPRAALLHSHYLQEHCNRTLSLPCTASKFQAVISYTNMLELVQDIGTLYPKLALQFTEANV